MVSILSYENAKIFIFNFDDFFLYNFMFIAILKKIILSKNLWRIMEKMKNIDSTSAFPKQEGAYCPSCGRYIGPYVVCPYCGARKKERISTKLLKIFSLSFSIIGVIIIWWAASHHMVPTLQAAEISNTTNFAYVQMKGVCTRNYSYDEKQKSLAFPLDDGTGTIWIKAYSAQAEEIYNSGNLPKPGDSVFVEGTVRMKGDYQYMIVNLPEKLRIKEPQPIELDISEITDSLWGTVVKTAGILNSVRKYENSIKFQLCSPNADACVEMYVYYKNFPNLDPDDYERGDTVALLGMVSSYKGKLQLSPRSEDEWWHKKGKKPTRKWTSGQKPPADAKEIRLKDLTKDMLGQYVKVSGTVRMVKQIKGGVLVKMDDGTEIITFPIWDRILETVPNADDLQKGAKISFTGKVGEYKGNLQVVPTYGPDVIITAGKTSYKSAAQKSSEAKEIKIADLTKDLIGQQVKVSGEIKWTKNIKGGILVGMNDGTGDMTFPIWDKVKKHIPDKDKIAEGNTITFIGKVGEYKGKLQVVPKWGENVWITEGSSSPQISESKTQTDETKKSSGEPIKIQLIELTDDLMGQIVTVEGEITKIKEVRGGYIITIRQGDEYMSTPFWKKSLKNFDFDALEKGAEITITGEVKEYRGNLQVVPRSADDVIVK
ncbi:hypothetical protein DRQ26_02300 [bacterium]|nr:MAG: hypothetical protein DRQ26_02300 [bacterium]